LLLALCSFSFGQTENVTSVCPGNKFEVLAKPTHLVRPNYPPVAVAVRGTGDVDVFVTVTPEGKVLTASAQNGHPLLRTASEVASSETTFEPIKQNCHRAAILTYTFQTGPPESDIQTSGPYHVQIFARERPAPKLVNGKNVCNDARFMASSGEAPTLSIKDVLQNPECVEGKVVRLYGIYSVGFEGSVYHDPTNTDSAWLVISPYYSIAKKCSTREAWNIWKSPDGGTFGLVSLGILRTGGGFGHMNGWDNEFQVMCIEEMKEFSTKTLLFEYQTPDVQKQILSWYKKQH
jgi:hypothetical protein